jgi:hypothetical protein
MAKSNTEKAWDKVYNLTLNPDLTKAQVLKVAKQVLTLAVINENELNEVIRASKDKDFCAEDVQDVLMSFVSCHL